MYRPRVYYTYTGAWFSQRPTQNSNYRQQDLHSKVYSADDVSHSIWWKEKHFVKGEVLRICTDKSESYLFDHSPESAVWVKEETHNIQFHLLLNISANSWIKTVVAGRVLSNVNNGWRLWVAALGPGYHSGRHHHKVRPTSPTSSKGPQTADHHFLHEKILISLQTGAAGHHSTERHVTVFFCKGG